MWQQEPLLQRYLSQLPDILGSWQLLPGVWEGVYVPPFYRCCVIWGISRVGVPLCFSFRVLCFFFFFFFGLDFFCHNSLNPFWLGVLCT